MSAADKKRIFVVEDEPHIAEGLKLNLSLQGHTVRIVGDGVSAIREWKAWRPDLIVLDIMLPGIDGLSVLKSIRLEDERVPILILSAKGDADDKVKGITFGGDDYLSKPFNLEEFLARVERLLTRVALAEQAAGGAHGLRTTRDTYVFGNNRIHFNTATAWGTDGEIRLTEQELKLLKLFIAHRGKPLTRRQLLEIGWGYTRATTTRTVDNFVVRLRKYFEKNPRKPVYFKSLRSVGYVFDHED